MDKYMLKKKKSFLVFLKKNRGLKKNVSENNMSVILDVVCRFRLIIQNTTNKYFIMYSYG